MLKEVRELWRFRELLWAMTERELKIRYKNSFLGFLWSLINPLVTVAVMTVVFKYLLNNQTPNFSAYVLAAYLPFVFIQFALLDSAQSVLASLPIVKKIYFPREILPLSTVLANFIHFLLALLVFFVYLLVLWASTGFADSPFTVTSVWLPGLLLVSLILAAGSSLIISALNVYYEDVKYLVSVLLYLMFFLTPIMYFSETVKHSLAQNFGDRADFLYTLYHLNPVANLSTAYRQVLLKPTPVDVAGETVPALAFQTGFFLYTVGFSIFVLIFGYHLFNRMKWGFVERP